MKPEKIQVLLGNLITMVRCYANLASQKAREAWMHAFAIEAEQVILKLKDMRTRWQESLPFHEAKDVHFSETRDQLRGWSAKLDEEPGIKQTVSELTDELDALEEFFCSDLKDEQFKELASRLVQQNCQAAIKQAHDLVHREHNSWPKRYEKERAGKMKEFVKKELVSVVRDDDLKYYIDLDYPDLLEDACFGQYLFKARHELSMGQVQQMVKLCTVIQDLNGYIDPNLEIRKRRDAAVGGNLSAEEKNIVTTLLQLVDRGKWKGGATTDSIKAGISRMLCGVFKLEDELQQMRDDLWRMLKTRRNCDAEKSLMVTWLNIVGWCVNRHYLSGGSPALCRTFFPKCGLDDYKAIDKGRYGKPSSFGKIEPLLEMFLNAGVKR